MLVTRKIEVALSDEERKTLKHAASILDELCSQMGDSCSLCPLGGQCARWGTPSDFVKDVIDALDET